MVALGYADAGVVGDLKTLSLCGFGGATLWKDVIWAAPSRSRCCSFGGWALLAEDGAATTALGDGTRGKVGVNS